MNWKLGQISLASQEQVVRLRLGPREIGLRIQLDNQQCFMGAGYADGDSWVSRVPLGELLLYFDTNSLPDEFANELTRRKISQVSIQLQLPLARANKPAILKYYEDQKWHRYTGGRPQGRFFELASPALLQKLVEFLTYAAERALPLWQDSSAWHILTALGWLAQKEGVIKEIGELEKYRGEQITKIKSKHVPSIFSGCLELGLCKIYYARHLATLKLAERNLQAMGGQISRQDLGVLLGHPEREMRCKALILLSLLAGETTKRASSEGAGAALKPGGAEVPR